MKILGIIPARFASTRFPGKPLVEIDGKSMIRRVVEQATSCNALFGVIVATDDERIFNHVQSFGYQVVMTSPDHPSGTDRCLEAYQKSGLHADAIINIQGDEPFVDPSQIDLLANLISKPEVEIATLAKRISDNASLFNPNKVKVIFSPNGRAIYFSRHAIPYQKNSPQNEWHLHHAYYKHIGLYAYQVSALTSICSLETSPLERAESLEQLRWIESGMSIYVAETDIETPAVDTPEDLKHILDNLL
ncbi:MAG: 3-deoxy-manno-octulosonate cytidylyltransferase [Flavobacteriales bacterium]|nr:3-deoxy-manno-octulosonate cytidylyltransferase [Flavobacteriales bacterium]